MKRILLINPPIYDFSAYDFWLKPYGLLRVAGYLRGQAELHLVDLLDRSHPDARELPSDSWGRGKFPSRQIPAPEALADIDRPYRRYGISSDLLRQTLQEWGPFDVALIQTNMTYWYPGVEEVLNIVRQESPGTRTVLGGVYSSICFDHAQSLGADLVVRGQQLEPLWQMLDLSPRLDEPAYWEGYGQLETGVIKLTEGCPFRCTYCSVPQISPDFAVRSREAVQRGLAHLLDCQVRHVVFYDDALLFKANEGLYPFLRNVIRTKPPCFFHTPNALNARFIDADGASLMVEAGFQHFYIGFESRSVQWQKRTGGKVYAHELEQAARFLQRAGAPLDRVTCYLIVGHPEGALDDLRASIRFAHELGLQVMLSEFSPIPGTPDGEACRPVTDLEEPLNHNKVAYSLRFLGEEVLQELKSEVAERNRTLASAG